MKVYASAVKKGIFHGEYRDMEIAVISHRTWLGYNFIYELDEKTWQLIGEVMHWKLKEVKR